MNTEPSPRPWRVEKAADECRFWIVRNPDGVSIGMTWLEDDAALIVAAVNDRDRLRDLVRRLLAAIDATHALVVRLAPSMLSPEIVPGETCLGVDVGDTVRDARALLAGEEPRHA